MDQWIGKSDSMVLQRPKHPVVLRRSDKRQAFDKLDIGMPCLGRRFEAKGMIVDLNTADPFAAYFECPDLIFSLQLARREYEIALGSDVMVARSLMPGAVTLSPKGASVRARTGEVDAEFLAFSFAPELVAQALEAAGLGWQAIRVAPELYHKDLLPLGCALRGFMLAPDEGSRIYGETLALAILLAAVSGLGQNKQPRIQVLGNQQLSLVFDFVEDHLESGCQLSEMAALLGLSVYNFTRAFRKATNTTPHQYVLGRRISRAREMLECGSETIADVAYAVGFSSQAHMTDVFRKKLGVTPGRYRDEFSS